MQPRCQSVNNSGGRCPHFAKKDSTLCTKCCRKKIAHNLPKAAEREPLVHNPFDPADAVPTSSLGKTYISCLHQVNRIVADMGFTRDDLDRLTTQGPSNGDFEHVGQKEIAKLQTLAKELQKAKISVTGLEVLVEAFLASSMPPRRHQRRCEKCRSFAKKDSTLCTKCCQKVSHNLPNNARKPMAHNPFDPADAVPTSSLGKTYISCLHQVNRIVADMGFTRDDLDRLTTQGPSNSDFEHVGQNEIAKLQKLAKELQTTNISVTGLEVLVEAFQRDMGMRKNAQAEQKKQDGSKPSKEEEANDQPDPLSPSE